MKRRVGAALRRGLQQQDMKTSIPEGDMYLLWDGGKEGIDHILLSGFMNEETTKTMQKQKLKLTVLYNQASQIERTGQRSLYSISNQELVTVISDKMLMLDERPREYYEGTNWSSYMGPVKLDPVKDLWTLTVEEKQHAYGPFIVLAGGKAEAGCKVREKQMWSQCVGIVPLCECGKAF